MAEFFVLEYWRKRYVRQAVIVGVLTGVCAIAGAVYFAYFGAKLLAICVSGAFFYLMFKAIREDLQARFEGMLLMNMAAKFEALVFDIGRGSGEEALLAQSVCPGYGVYECFNVVKGEGFCFEEIRLLEDVRFFGVAWPVFEGVIFSVICSKVDKEMSGRAFLQENKLIIEGGAGGVLSEARAEVRALLEAFGVREAKVAVYQGKIYFWLNGGQALYWQAKLFSPNKAYLFDDRLEKLEALGRGMADKMTGG